MFVKFYFKEVLLIIGYMKVTQTLYSYGTDG